MMSQFNNPIIGHNLRLRKDRKIMTIKKIKNWIKIKIAGRNNYCTNQTNIFITNNQNFLLIVIGNNSTIHINNMTMDIVMIKEALMIMIIIVIDLLLFANNCY